MKRNLTRKKCYYQGIVGFILLYMACVGGHAAELPGGDASLIKNAGIAIVDGVDFVNGNQDVGFRFATSKPLEEVRAWYEKQLSAWSLYSQYGGWILYEGKPGLGLGDLMTVKQVQVQSNPNMSEWYGVDKNKSTEIVIMIPK